VPACVTRSRDRQQILINPDCIIPRKDALDVRRGTGHVVAMQYSFGFEMRGPSLVVGYVVAMREKHQPHAAELGDAFCEWPGKSR